LIVFYRLLVFVRGNLKDLAGLNIAYNPLFLTASQTYSRSSQNNREFKKTASATAKGRSLDKGFMSFVLRKFWSISLPSSTK